MLAPHTTMITGTWAKVAARFLAPTSVRRSVSFPGSGIASTRFTKPASASPRRARCSASRTTTKSQPWVLLPLEARVAAHSTLSTSSSGTGSVWKNRIARAVPIASKTSIGAVLR